MDGSSMPATWRTSTLGAIAKAEYGLIDGPFGSNLPASSYTETGIPVIRGSNLSVGAERFLDDEFVYVSDETAKRLHRSLCEAGDIIFTKKGTLGQTGLVPENHKFSTFLVSSNQMKLSVNPDVADSRYVYYFVSSRNSIEKIKRDAEATGVPKTNLAYLRQFPIVLPPLAEQRTIAHILGSLDDKIELNRQMNRTLEEMAQAIFKSWFVDFDPVHAKATGEQPTGMDAATAALFPDSFEEIELGLVPRGWRVESVGDIVSVVGGGTPSTKNSEFWDGGSYYFATPKDMSSLHGPILIETERKVTDAGLVQISSGLLPSGTVLLSSRAPIGYLALTNVPVAINQGFIAMLCNGPVSNYYMLHWTYTNMDRIKANAGGTTFPEISKRNFRPLPAIVPTKSIIDAFDALVGPQYELIANNELESRTLAKLRDTLLPKLMSGELRVPGATDLL
jgi:type I restriction enzyme, S subunit